MPVLFVEIFTAGWLITLAFLAGAIGGYHRYRRESQGLLGWVVVTAAVAVVSFRLSDIEAVLIIFIAALGLFGSSTIIGIPFWLGLRRIGRGKLVDAAVAGMVVACLGWWSFVFLGGDRDWVKIIEPSYILAAIAVAGGVGGLIAWHLAYGRKVSANVGSDVDRLKNN
jgi:hypothetical protein